MIKILDKNRILVLCILGSLFRLIYGSIYELWSMAPDHLAWELILEQSSFRYDHLIHYPHEGGTIFISLMSHLIEAVTDFSSLTVSAFIFDFLVRLLQIIIVDKVFGKQIALFFGLWTVFATPIIIPWGTLNFGLHSISSVFPFLLVLLLSENRNTIKYHIYCGLFLGLAVWFSYSNLVLIPVFLMYRLFEKHKFKDWYYTVISLTGVLILHIMVRQFFDAGFHLNKIGLISIRGASFSMTGIDIFDRLSSIPRIIANSSITLENPLIAVKTSQLMYYIFCIFSLLGFYIAYKKEKIVKSIYVIFSVIVLFFVSYLFSPFYHSPDSGNYITFRYLAYITPLVALFIIIGLSAIKQKWFVITFLVFGLFQSSQLFTLKKEQVNDTYTKAIGWTLGTKLGHDPNQLIPIVEDNVEESHLIVQGIGWGISTSIMSNEKKDTKQKIKQQVDLFFKYPNSYHGDLLEGIRFSFSDVVTPRLDGAVLGKIEDEINKRAKTIH